MAITRDVITLTPTAAAKIKDLLAEEEPGSALRLFVTQGGCSGYSYGMALDNEVRQGDQVVEQHGVRVYVDALAARLLRGTEIDFTRSVMGEGFTMRNPNAVGTCGCGHSFTTAEDSGVADPCDDGETMERA